MTVEPHEPRDEREVKAELALKAPAWLADAGLKVSVRRLWDRRCKRFSEVTADRAGLSTDALADRLEAAEALLDLYLEAVERAVRVADEDYRDALANLVATAFRDDARIDTAAYALSVLKQLAPAELRILHRLARVTVNDDKGAAQPAGRNVPNEIVRSLVQADAAFVNAAKARLTALGLVNDVSTGFTIANMEGRTWSISVFGRSVLDLCQDSDRTEPEPEPTEL